ncbi:hypothetical protein X011_23220 [Mycobacterium tuberculosis variant microti OV254]|nr:hypothetical protein X011_23220 [Mycobacterium tuberculosis variant microti OV254]
MSRVDLILLSMRRWVDEMTRSVDRPRALSHTGFQGSKRMTITDVRTDLVLVHSTQAATIHAPIGSVNIADWVLNLPDAEYQRCAPPDHLAAGSTTTDDGRPMSINVEEIGGALVVQHYVAELHEPHHCHLVSMSDLRTPLGWSKIQVIWDLSVSAEDGGTCRFTNLVISYPTHGFLDMLEAAGQTFEHAAAALQEAVADHNRRETLLFADSIERHAAATSAS